MIRELRDRFVNVSLFYTDKFQMGESKRVDVFTVRIIISRP